MSVPAWLFRAWYWYINRIDRDAELLFLNYGYANGDAPLALDAADEGNRYGIQLYRHLADAVTLRGRDLVEVGCGRGGGLSWIVRTYAPASAVGVDLEAGAVDFCRRHYHEPGLAFRQGDAHDLPLADGACDVVLSLESSHRYRDLGAFLSEVRRVLRPRGHLALADFRHHTELPPFLGALRSCGLRLEGEEDLTDGVVAALERDDARRRRLVRKMLPRIVRGRGLDFAGAVGSSTFRQLAAHELLYRQYVFRKD